MLMRGMLSREEFNILAELAERCDCIINRRNERINIKDDVIDELEIRNLISNNKITEAGLEALEPYRVKRAIFIAAGFGSRLVPITINTPKPLVKVNGRRIIDGLLDACVQAGIDEIYIVRGYLSENFDILKYKYPNVKFIENPMFSEANNISSAMCARYLLSSAYVFEADLKISNPSIIKKYHYTSDFLGIKKNKTDDWCFIVKDNVITEQKTSGEGNDCYQMVGISYWNEADGKKLCNHLEQVFSMPEGKNKYWEQVPLDVFKDEYRVEIRECLEDDIVEIDTFNELKAIDQSYDI